MVVKPLAWEATFVIRSRSYKEHHINLHKPAGTSDRPLALDIQPRLVENPLGPLKPCCTREQPGEVPSSCGKGEKMPIGVGGKAASPQPRGRSPRAAV